MTNTKLSKNEKRELARRFELLRGSRTFAEMAELTKVPAASLYRCELGGTPNVKNLRLLHEHMGVDLNWLLCGDGKPPK